MVERMENLKLDDNATAFFTTYGAHTGWGYLGSLTLDKVKGFDADKPFHKHLYVVTMAEGGHFDMVQNYDAGVLTAGPIQATAASTALWTTLHRVPSGRDEYLRDIADESGGYFNASTGFLYRDEDRSMLVGEKAYRGLMFGGCGNPAWSGEGMDLAEKWLKGCLLLLRDKAHQQELLESYVETMEGYLPVALRTARVADQIVYLAFAINSPAAALRLWISVSQRGDSYKAERMLEQAAGEAGDQKLLLPHTFKERVPAIRKALMVMNVKVER